MLRTKILSFQDGNLKSRALKKVLDFNKGKIPFVFQGETDFVSVERAFITKKRRAENRLTKREFVSIVTGKNYRDILEAAALNKAIKATRAYHICRAWDTIISRMGLEYQTANYASSIRNALKKETALLKG